MQRLLASYLLKNRNCPLPGLGSLQMSLEDSTYQPSTHSFTAPFQKIKLTNQELPSDNLIQFIAAKTNLPFARAEKDLHDFCARLKKMKKNDEEISLPYAGKFITHSFGRIEFVAEDYNQKFLPPIIAEPVTKKINRMNCWLAKIPVVPEKWSLILLR